MRRNASLTNGPDVRHTGPVRVRLPPLAQRAAPLASDRLGLAIFLRPSDRRKCFEGLSLRRSRLRAT